MQVGVFGCFGRDGDAERKVEEGKEGKESIARRSKGKIGGGKK